MDLLWMKQKKIKSTTKTEKHGDISREKRYANITFNNVITDWSSNISTLQSSKQLNPQMGVNK